MITAKFTNEINDLITENLYQWDTYQTLKISGIDFGSVAPRVHFANKKSTEALVVDAFISSDGSVEVSIPNSLLTEKYDILAYVYINTGLTSKTIKSITIPIIPRLKPSEYYQPSDEDIAQIEAIELEAKAIIDGLTASEFNLSENYKRPNIVYYNGSAYMCKSSTTIAGILPTSTAMWQKICDGSVLTSINKDANGNLVFVFSSGKEFTFNIAVADANGVDSDDFPAFKLTIEDVNKIKSMVHNDGKTSLYNLGKMFSVLVYIPTYADSTYAVVRTYTHTLDEDEIDIKVSILEPGFHLVYWHHNEEEKIVYHRIDGREESYQYSDSASGLYIDTTIYYPNNANTKNHEFVVYDSYL